MTVLWTVRTATGFSAEKQVQLEEPEKARFKRAFSTKYALRRVKYCYAM